ncbi:hypothetical protein EK21DRAFT_84535 [Setomelanomma holmii]|uniref:CDP-alcohol phosphatidyltransferase n=1 Tax=Setomelanomma holmii TaxID=210430 RepID=A0A9P4HI28_9PLEO|nr:hypothetical protein EK21DRAFT_84535 [Setomelanomma holmii]
MLDTHLRPLKDQIFDSITSLVPIALSPLHITVLAFLAGIQSCIYAASAKLLPSLIFWTLNRVLDCLDGAVARKRDQASDFGGFLDLLCDFIIYSAIPISCALSLEDAGKSVWLSVAVLEASFHVNNFVLFYVAAIIEKQKGSGKAGAKKVEELTSIAMRPALIEGTESAVFFTAKLTFPEHLQLLSWCMALLVCVGIVQRTVWLAYALL